MNSNQVLLKEIQAEDFAVYEAALYLNGHPGCQEALTYYHNHRKALCDLRNQYEAQFGPLTLYGNEEACHWHWIDSPWPWEKEAN